MHKIKTAIYFTINPEAAYTPIDHEAVLLGADEDAYSLNYVATEIFNRLKSQPMSIQDISDYLLQEFETDETQSMADASSFVRNLLAKNLIIGIKEMEAGVGIEPA